MIKAVATIQNNGKMTTMGIPKVVVDKLELKKGDRVFITVNEKNEIIIKK